MPSLILTIVGGLIALFGVGWILYQARTRQFTSLALAVWVLRTGLLIFFAAEVWALFVRPEGNLTYKVMLVSSALIAGLGLALLPMEFIQPGLVLERSLSWQVILFSLSVFLIAVMFLQGFVMLGLTLVVWLGVRQARRWTKAATEADRRRVLALAFYTQLGVIALTFILLFL